MTRPDALSSKGSIIYEEPPLLEDVGVDPELIADKIISIIKLETPTQRYIEESDLFGPSMIAFLLGLLLMLSGKMHFGDIYALFVLGNILIFVLFNLMSSKEIISLYAIMSTLGYCLFPMLLVGTGGYIYEASKLFGNSIEPGIVGVVCIFGFGLYWDIDKSEWEWSEDANRVPAVFVLCKFCNDHYILSILINLFSQYEPARQWIYNFIDERKWETDKPTGG